MRQLQSESLLLGQGGLLAHCSLAAEVTKHAVYPNKQNSAWGAGEKWIVRIVCMINRKLKKIFQLQFNLFSSLTFKHFPF